jgi:hypothetical protein
MISEPKNSLPSSVARMDSEGVKEDDVSFNRVSDALTLWCVSSPDLGEDFDDSSSSPEFFEMSCANNLMSRMQ